MTELPLVCLLPFDPHRHIVSGPGVFTLRLPAIPWIIPAEWELVGLEVQAVSEEPLSVTVSMGETIVASPLADDPAPCEVRKTWPLEPGPVPAEVALVVEVLSAGPIALTAALLVRPVRMPDPGFPPLPFEDAPFGGVHFRDSIGMAPGEAMPPPTPPTRLAVLLRISPHRRRTHCMSGDAVIAREPASPRPFLDGLFELLPFIAPLPTNAGLWIWSAGDGWRRMTPNETARVANGRSPLDLA